MIGCVVPAGNRPAKCACGLLFVAVVEIFVVDGDDATDIACTIEKERNDISSVGWNCSSVGRYHDESSFSFDKTHLLNRKRPFF